MKKISKFNLIMPSAKVNNHWGDLQIGFYENSDVYPLMPILQQEFPNWNSKRINSYMQLVMSEDKNISGVITAKNESGYYVGCLIYTYQQVSSEIINNTSDENKTFNVFVVENLNSCVPILQKKIFLSLIDEAIYIAKTNYCEYIELPNLANEGYELIKTKYNNQIQEPKTFRTYLKIPESLIPYESINV